MNNMMQMMQMMQMVGNPQALMQQMMNNNQVMQNPLAKNAIEKYQKGDINGLRNMAENLAKERGTTIDEVKSSLMRQFGMK